MTETVYSATRIFDKLIGKHVVSVDAGTGNVEIQIVHGDGNYISVETISADGITTVDFGIGRRYRFVVTGDATFAI